MSAVLSKNSIENLPNFLINSEQRKGLGYQLRVIISGLAWIYL